MKTTLLIHTIGLIFICCVAAGQNSTNIGREPISRKGEFLISAFAGYPFGGAKDEIISNIRTSGFDNTCFPIFGSYLVSIGFPKSFKFLVFDLEATYFFSRTMGVTINTSIFDHVEVQGYDDIGYGNLLIINSRTKSTSSALTLRTKNNKHHFMIGPAYIKHLESGEGHSSTEKYRQNNLGLVVGYTFHVQWSEHFFIGMKLNYRWAPDFKSGPFEVEHYTSAAGIGLVNNKSFYTRSTVNPSCLNAGVSLGLSF